MHLVVALRVQAPLDPLSSSQPEVLLWPTGEQEDRPMNFELLELLTTINHMHLRTTEILQRQVKLT